MFLRGLFIWTVIVCTMAGCANQNHSPKIKQHLRLNIYSEPPSLDPRKATDSTSMNVLLMLFEGLMRIGEDHKPHLALAEKLTLSEDKKSYEFVIRESYWSNGERLTSKDFLYAWQTMLDPKFPSLFAYKLYDIENAAEIKNGKLPVEALGVEAPNDQTLIIHLRFPTPYFLELLAFPTFYPINKSIDQQKPNWADEAGPEFISNGPFTLKKWQHDNEIIVVSNSQYWDREAVRLQQIHLSMIDDVTTEFYMYEGGELDWAGSPLSNLPPDFISALKKVANFYPASAVYYYKINTKHFPLGNTNIRKALGYAINRKEIVEHVTQGGQIPATCLVPPMPGWNSLNLFKDGNDKAAVELFKKGLEELGLLPEKFPTITLSFNTNREHQRIAQAIQQQWKKVLGIDIQLLHFDWKVYLSKISSQNFEIGRMGWIGDFNDPISFLEPFKYNNDPETGGNNDTGWENPFYTALLNRAQKETDGEKRNDLLHQAEALLISEMPIIPIYFIVNGYLKKPYVHGVYLSPLGMMDLKKAYLQ